MVAFLYCSNNYVHRPGEDMIGDLTMANTYRVLQYIVES